MMPFFILVPPVLELPRRKGEPFHWTAGTLLSGALDGRRHSGRTSCGPGHGSARMAWALPPDSDRTDRSAPPDSPRRLPLTIHQDCQACLAGRGCLVAVTDRDQECDRSVRAVYRPQPHLDL